MLKVIGLYDWTKNLPQGIKTELKDASQSRRLRDGEHIYHIGDVPDACYRIKTGQVEIQNFTITGKQITIAEFFDGDCFGQGSLIEGIARFNSAVSVGETLLQSLSARAFHDLYRKHAEISQAINRNLCHRLRNALCMVQGASLFTLRERLISLIARLATYRGANVDDVTLLSDVSHEKLAHMLGTNRQSVSRELKILETEGLLQLQYGKICIPDLGKLVAMYEEMISAELLSPEYPKTRSPGRRTRDA